MITNGTRVRTAEALDARDFTQETQQRRRPGCQGTIIGYSNAHGLCFKVRHDDGVEAHYDEDELTVLADSSPLVTRFPHIDADPMRVAHASLQRISSDSEFKAYCPRCKDGLLLVARDRTTFRLIREDRCLSCAQRVVYTDTQIGGELLPKEN